MAVEGAIITPGQRLGLVEEFEPGVGTSIQPPFICAAIVGTTHITPADTDTSKPQLSILRKGASPVIPAVKDLVTARVTRINPRQASLDILSVGTTPVAHKFTAVIRQQDVRSTEIDKVQIQLCFRPGDIVRAEVLSLGDARSYYLTTTREELGVVEAKSLAGVSMIPISLEEMRCPSTNTAEKRKVAAALQQPAQ